MKTQQVTCVEKARATRAVARIKGAGILQREMFFVTTLLASMMSAIVMTIFPGQRKSRPVERDKAREILRHRRQDPAPRHHRYGGGSIPLSRLLKDLKRPAASKDALDALLMRVPDEHVRRWLIAAVAKQSFMRVALHARHYETEEQVFKAWEIEAEADNFSLEHRQSVSDRDGGSVDGEAPTGPVIDSEKKMPVSDEDDSDPTGPKIP